MSLNLDCNKPLISARDRGMCKVRAQAPTRPRTHVRDSGATHLARTRVFLPLFCLSPKLETFDSPN